MNGLSKEPRLQFTEEERSDPALKKPVQKAEKAAGKADKAQAKIPKRVKKVKQRTVDPATGKVSVRLSFEEIDKKKPPSKLEHTLKDAPGNLAIGHIHREIRSSEDDNVGVESAHKSEETIETSSRIVRDGYRSHKLKPYRKAAQAEHRLEKANIHALYEKSLRDNPQLASNPISRWQQKQTIKKQYAAAKHSTQNAAVKSTAAHTEKAVQKAAEKAKQAGQFVWRHRRGFSIAIAFLLVLCMMLNTMSSCSMMVQSVGSAVTGSTFPSEDDAMLGAEAAYAAKEAQLQADLDSYEATHSYDEYHFDLDTIEHDPYVLISILTAYHGGAWTLPEVQGTMQMLFERQYILTEDVVHEIRYRTETRIGTRDVTDPVTGTVTTEEYEYQVQVPYDYFICTVTLDNFNLSHLPIYIMSEKQISMYAIYMATHGNRPDLFPQGQYPNASVHKDYLDYEVPPAALADAQFATILKEAEKYLGFPYVWGGSNPSTSFDCSGYVSWVINHSGWNVGRLGAQSLCNICTPVSQSNAKPGDLVFFEGTYDTDGVSHVGIYVGNSMMIHCGDPISYANLNSSYWQSHLYTYGRLPPP